MKKLLILPLFILLAVGAVTIGCEQQAGYQTEGTERVGGAAGAP